MRSQGGGAINLGDVVEHSGGRRAREEKRRRGGREGYEESEDE
jgi:hypothetical protein